MNVGVIGAGYWGKKHADEYTQTGASVTVSDLIDSNLKECKERFNCKTTRDYNDILSDDNIKGVSICTPNKTHYDICKECLHAGKNVLVEKPMTLDYDKARELIEIAKSRGLVLAVGHLYRFNNAVRKVKELVDGGELGDILAVKMSWTYLEPIFKDRDILFDLAIHPLDILHFIFGRLPDNMSALARGFRQENEEIAFVNGTLGSTVVHFDLSWLTPEKARDMLIVGSNKTVFVKLVMQKVKLRDNNTLEDREIEISESNTIREELEDFMGCIEDKREPIARADIGADVVRAVQNIRKL
ncbi:MAG: hypothetical protein DRO99_01710 [Candidatus Aenigmatarchaeota archaeon]|mgnify:CR=1 FL=1|nr:MAG: hypothetical protein DRO99_01710 [Candidatus Aenigmarchaeota archaeon]